MENLSYYYRRMNEVEEINSRSYNKSESAKRRDMWLINSLVEADRPKLTPEQIAEVEAFWKPYEFAYQNDYRQQEIFTAFSGKFDPSYFGFGMQRYLMLPFYNHETAKWICEKNFTPLFFRDVKMPETYIFNSFGVYYDADRNPISLEKALELLLQKLKSAPGNEAIIKPSDSGEGKNINFIPADITSEEALKLLKKYGNNFICQRVVKNHPSFAAPYDKSLNTMRMITMYWKGKVHYVGAVLRMGTSKRVDNWSQGGLACGIEPDGRLKEFAFTEQGELVSKHPVSGLVFKDHVLYRYPEAVELVKHLHGNVAWQRYISWDITVDDAGDLMMIECNSPGSHELVQMGGYHGYVNQEIAKEIFDEYLIRRFFYEKANFDWNYREFKDHISLREYKGVEKTVIVPKEIDGKPVRILYKNAIPQKDILRIMIPSTVTYERNAVSDESIIERY